MPPIDHRKGIFCNRTLNFRSLQAIGYDMDYTLIHYHVEAWEGRAYEHIRTRLEKRGWPVADMTFTPELVQRGLVVDKQLGNLVKINRHGYVKRASHGTQMLDFDALRRTYNRTMVDLKDGRYHFLNTLFSLSEGCIYGQLIELMDQGKLPEVMGYSELWSTIRETLDAAHVEGQLKAEIMSNPEQYIDLDPALPQALLDQKQSGKQLLLITNSEWSYTRFLMSYAFDPFLPTGMTWKELFDMVIVSARKPAFFEGDAPIFKVVDEQGMLLPCIKPTPAHSFYLGGNASHVEEFLGYSGSKILYVGDHIFSDVNVSKRLLRWRTALILHELEGELVEFTQSEERRQRLQQLMARKEELEHQMSHIRLHLQHLEHELTSVEELGKSQEQLEQELETLRETWKALDDDIIPLVIKESRNFNENWGYLMRDGTDKTHLTHQVEKYADIYTARVSNFAHYTPFCYFRQPNIIAPHDPVDPRLEEPNALPTPNLPEPTPPKPTPDPDDTTEDKDNTTQ